MRKAIMVLMILAIAGGAFAQNLGSAKDPSNTTPDAIQAPLAEGKTCGECPPDAVLEGEPALVDEYVDMHNGGCNSAGEPFQTINWANTAAGDAWLCGVSGWFSVAGVGNRDTDWFVAYFGPTGQIDLTVTSEYDVFIFELGPQDCGTVGVLQNLAATCDTPATLTVFGAEGTPVWLWIGPTAFEGPVTEFSYYATLSGHQWEGPVANEDKSWGEVKSLYR